MAVPEPISLSTVFDALEFLPDRRPGMDGDPEAKWCDTAATYRDGGVFVVHYAGQSEWERHPVGDEVVMVVEGSTTLTLHLDGAEHAITLRSMQMVIVPQNTWHRFDTPEAAKIMTITPQPTEHSLAGPTDD